MGKEFLGLDNGGFLTMIRKQEGTLITYQLERERATTHNNHTKKRVALAFLVLRLI